MKCFLDLKGEGLRLDEKQMREEVPRDRGRGPRAQLKDPGRCPSNSVDPGAL